MLTLRFHHDDEETARVYRFPAESTRGNNSPSLPTQDPGAMALDALDSMDRRIDHLARELNCLVHFNKDDDDRPRAA